MIKFTTQGVTVEFNTPEEAYSFMQMASEPTEVDTHRVFNDSEEEEVLAFSTTGMNDLYQKYLYDMKVGNYTPEGTVELEEEPTFEDALAKIIEESVIREVEEDEQFDDNSWGDFTVSVDEPEMKMFGQTICEGCSECSCEEEEEKLLVALTLDEITLISQLTSLVARDDTAYKLGTKVDSAIEACMGEEYLVSVFDNNQVRHEYTESEGLVLKIK